MTSILNNAGAMVALATLQITNRNLLEVQTQISTGKRVDSAAQDAAIWAVTTVMEADVDGFRAISESLSLGTATVTVARNAAEKTTELLREMKEKIVTAQGENVDRAKIQTDIDELKNQIESIVSAAQFNGLNLIDGSKPQGIDIVSSLDRSTTGVTAASISVASQNLSTGQATAGSGAATANVVTARDSETNATTVTNANLDVDLAIAGTTTSAADFELYVDGVSVGSNVTIAAGATQEEVRQEVQQYIETLGLADIQATVDGSGVLIENNGMFDTRTVELRMGGNGGLTTTTNTNTALALDPTISSVQTSSTDSAGAATAATADATITLTNAANGDIFDISIGGVALGAHTINVGGGTDAEAATNLAAFLNTQITASTTLSGKVTAVVDTVVTTQINLISNTGENLDIVVTLNTGGADTELALGTSNRTGDGDVAAGTIVAAGGAVAGVAVSGVIEGKGADIQFDLNAVAEGDSYTVYLREGTTGPVGTFTYVADSDDTANDVAAGLEALIRADSNYDVFVAAESVVDPTAENVRLRIDSTGSQDVYVAVEGKQGGQGSGGLGRLSGINVLTRQSAEQALADIENLIQTSIDAAAAFGSSERRLEIQEDFVSSLIDSMNLGIGALVDTDMEYASARLQALQVQQQLGTQALAIANAAPQNILSLFQ